MDSIELAIADALAAAISATTFLGPITSVTATRAYVPDHQASDLETLKVNVVPGTVEISALSHGADLFESTIHVTIGKRAPTDVEVDDLVELRTQIADAIRSNKLTAGYPAMPTGVVWMSIDNMTTFDRDALTGQRVFLSDMAVTYRRSQAKL